MYNGNVADAAGLREEGPEKYGVVPLVVGLGELVVVDAFHERFAVGDYPSRWEGCGDVCGE